VSNTTRESLLLRLRRQPPDQDAWGEFVASYGPLIRAWCRERGLADADVQDACQDVLTKLVTALRKFTYDPAGRFRGWLRRVVQHALTDYHQERGREPARGSGDTCVLELLGCQQAREELAVRLQDAFDLDLFDRAVEAVRSRVAPANWQAFVRTILEGRGVEETARELGLDAGRVYVARCRIQNKLKYEVQRLESELLIEGSSTDGERRLSGAERSAPVHRPIA
jgi:RNA polymerase sigma factor (sigma-70 family)